MGARSAVAPAAGRAVDSHAREGAPEHVAAHPHRRVEQRERGHVALVERRAPVRVALLRRRLEELVERLRVLEVRREQRRAGRRRRAAAGALAAAAGALAFAAAALAPAFAGRTTPADAERDDVDGRGEHRRVLVAGRVPLEPVELQAPLNY